MWHLTCMLEMSGSNLGQNTVLQFYLFCMGGTLCHTKGRILIQGKEFCLLDCNTMLSTEGRAIAQPVNRWLPTAAVRVWSCGICGGQSGAGAGFLRVLLFPLPIFVPPIAPQSPSSIIWALYNRPKVAAVPSRLSPTPLIIIIKKWCCPLKINHRFERTCCFQLKGQRICQAKNYHEAGNEHTRTCYLLHAGLLDESLLKWKYEKDKERERKRVNDKIWRKWCKDPSTNGTKVA
jgi:hypothetical protein